MSLIQLDNIAVHFPQDTLFEGLSWQILPKDRCGLIGANGSGKTTILRLITGEIEPNEGTIRRVKQLTAGYLPQEGVVEEERTLFDAAYSALPDLPVLQSEIEELQQKLASEGPSEDILERLGALEHRWQALEGYSAESRVARVLSGLGFRKEDHERPVATFSGGWQMRVALAKLLLKEPDVLLLDEPTNHLDLPTLDWLEEYLTEFRGALVIVSHDRAFLDRMVTSIVEIDRGHLRKYVGSYSDFERGREERREKLRQHAERLSSERKRIERFIERFRYKNTKARQVQSRVRLLKKLEQVEEETEARQIHFRFPPAPHSGRVVLEVNSLSKSYDGKEVLREIDLVLERGQKVALVGVNGAGKSTFCRMITGTEPPDSGEAKLGYKVDLDYFAQEADFHLTGGQSVLDELAESATVSQIPNLRKMLGAFLFSGEDVFKLVDVLSGGEKSRLALVKMLLRPSNFIILDEPTNHLDISSKDVLLSALKSFAGTLLIVSHDRYFLDRLVDRVLELDDGRLKDWPGNFGEYLERKALFQEKKKEEITAPQKSPAKTGGRKTKEQRRIEAEKRNRYSQERRQIQTEMDELTQTIEQMETRKSELEVQLGDEETYQKGEQARDIVQEYERIQSELPELYERWERLEEQREAIEKAIHS